LEYGEEINQALREPGGITNSGDAATILNLEMAIARSRINTGYRLYRGVGGNYGTEILENLSRGRARIKTNEFSSFSYNRDRAYEYASLFGPESVVFITECSAGENTLFIGGDEEEIIFPRFQKWRITEAGISEILGTKTTFIYLERIL